MKIYKQPIPNSEDWNTNTDNPMINAFREVMANNNQYQDDPMVGIFWYDVEEQDLFGVYSVDASHEDFYFSEGFNANVRTCNRMHYAMWQKYKNKYANTKKGEIYKQEYNQVPRGRVFEIEDEGFVVCVGKWINDYPEAKSLILDEFQLPDNTEFLIDSHWDLGHGWSDKHF